MSFHTARKGPRFSNFITSYCFWQSDILTSHLLILIECYYEIFLLEIILYDILLMGGQYFWKKKLYKTRVKISGTFSYCQVFVLFTTSKLYDQLNKHHEACTVFHILFTTIFFILLNNVFFMIVLNSNADIEFKKMT